MDKKAVAERLRALAADDLRRSKAARLRDVIDDVESALAAGVPRSDVLAELKAHGLDMSLATFETTLKRLRAKRGQAAARTLPTGRPSLPARSPGSVPVPQSPPYPPGPGDTSHKPSDIDEIMGTAPDLVELSKIAKRSKK